MIKCDISEVLELTQCLHVVGKANFLDAGLRGLEIKGNFSEAGFENETYNIEAVVNVTVVRTVETTPAGAHGTIVAETVTKTLTSQDFGAWLNILERDEY